MPGKKKYHKLKTVVIVLLLIVIIFLGYVAVVNRNSKNMTGRQKMLKAVYPLLMGWNKLTGKSSKVLEKNKTALPAESIYDLRIALNNGDTIPLSAYKGKKILLVNTASDCGYTNQYDDLQKLYRQYNDKLVVIGFPANDFKEQEKGNDEEIAQFCKINYGVTFPLVKKSTVVKGDHQNPVFQWLTDKSRNGWNNQQPTWNFAKYLVDESGVLTHYFDPSISPLQDVVLNAIR